MVHAEDVERLRIAAEEARSEYVRATMDWLRERHRVSLEKLAAYDRGETDGPLDKSRSAK